jgi:hypothetical protein
LRQKENFQETLKSKNGATEPGQTEQEKQGGTEGNRISYLAKMQAGGTLLASLRGRAAEPAG